MECSVPESKEICTQFDVSGLPSIIVTLRDKYYIFNKHRTVEKVLDFVDRVVAGEVTDFKWFPKSRSEYNMWDKFYFGFMSYSDSLGRIIERNPIKSIAAIVLTMLSMMALFLYILDTDGEEAKVTNMEKDMDKKENGKKVEQKGKESKDKVE